MNVFLLSLGVILLIGDVVTTQTTKPHIVFIIADDLGWNDIGFHNPEIKSPNIDKLATEGLILNSSYVQPLCSPSRSAIMTGYYPFKMGLQHLVILPYQPVCVPLNITLLPEALRDLGYATHMVGKWHLGFCSWNCTPTYRGFDSFFGYYNADEDYYTHTVDDYLDLRDNKTPARNLNGTYSTNYFASLATDIINRHNKSQPLFLYLPFQAVHEPIEVPKRYEDLYPNIQNEGRRKFSGMVSALDEAVGNVTSALKQNGMLDDTLIFFTADNGGWIPYYGNNYPLRGGKFTIYEGGTRTVAFINGKRLQNSGTVYEGLMHAIDWMPTIVAAAGGIPDNSRDGMNLWSDLNNGSLSGRKEFVYNLDSHFPPLEGHAALRMGDYKMVEGYPGEFPDWYKPQQLPEDSPIKQDKFEKKPYPWYQYQLFNIKDDPTEHNDLSTKLPDILAKMKARLNEYKKQMVPPNFPILPDPKSDPALYNNTWSPGWC
ncbi:arylsulfatase B-like [Gigantopelta aegis]|uniref:arylsulfatase B-like n=1 Tax=Gigantopelta aegis TaxID=1735272 RepID=UPI001B88C937|nr:arylsulfatase B-like [Gigantopelta aegis]